MIKSKLQNQSTIIRSMLAVLATAACLAAVKSLVWPVWPHVHELNKKSLINGLREAGFKADQLNTLPPIRSAELTTSPVLGFTIDEGHELWVVRGATKERFNFQTAFLSRKYPELKLIKRTVSRSLSSSSEGLNSGGKARQTCLVEGLTFPAGFGVTRNELAALTDQKETRSSQIKSILGLTKNRHYECILITVRSKDGKELLDEGRWTKLLHSLQRSTNNSLKAN